MNNNQERKVAISGGVAENRKNERGHVGRCSHVNTPLPRDHALFFWFPAIPPGITTKNDARNIKLTANPETSFRQICDELQLGIKFVFSS